MSNRWNELKPKIARRFFLATVLQAMASFGLFAVLVFLHSPKPPSDTVYLPVAFQYGTVFLILGSYFLHLAVREVRVEHQLQFRRALMIALGFAVLFVGVQSYGLWEFTKGVADYKSPQTNAHGFTLVFVAIHAMHFLIAQSILLWVTLCAFADRYDHEYYWGVVFASWAWHGLGLVWIVVLCTFGIVSLGPPPPGGPYPVPRTSELTTEVFFQTCECDLPATQSIFR